MGFEKGFYALIHRGGYKIFLLNLLTDDIFEKFFIARYLLYNIVLVSAIYQHQSVTGIHMSPLS